MLSFGQKSARKEEAKLWLDGKGFENFVAMLVNLETRLLIVDCLLISGAWTSFFVCKRMIVVSAQEHFWHSWCSFQQTWEQQPFHCKASDVPQFKWDEWSRNLFNYVGMVCKHFMFVSTFINMTNQYKVTPSQPWIFLGSDLSPLVPSLQPIGWSRIFPSHLGQQICPCVIPWNCSSGDHNISGGSKKAKGVWMSFSRVAMHCGFRMMLGGDGWLSLNSTHVRDELCPFWR